MWLSPKQLILAWPLMAILVAGSSLINAGNLPLENPVSKITSIANQKKLTMVLVEMPIGTYFGADDIVRYEDEYTRL